VTTVDDGKVNALTFELMEGLRSAIASASEQGRPLVITGRDGCLSAGFDLAVVNSGVEGPHHRTLRRRRRALWRHGGGTDSGHRVLHGSRPRRWCAPPPQRRLPDRPERDVPPGPQRDPNRPGVAQFRRQPGHASIGAPVPHGGDHVRRSGPRRRGRWTWGTSMRAWMILCRGRARWRKNWPPCPRGVRHDEAPYPADIATGVGGHATVRSGRPAGSHPSGECALV